MDDMQERANAPINEGEFTEAPQSSSSTALATRYEARGGAITAQRVALPRNEAAIRNKIKIYAAMAGDDWYYRWPTKNKDGTKGWVEGPSIDCAESVAAIVGNNQVDCDMRDAGSHWLFLARYVDLETGFTLTRPYQQRKEQNIGGKMDKARAEDIIFQIGASKATRNVICNAIRVFTNFAFEEAKQNLAETIGNNIEKYRAKVISRLSDLSIPLPRVERLYAKKISEFLSPDLAKVIAEIKAIDEGMAGRDECYPPTPEEQAEHLAEAQKTDAPAPVKSEIDWGNWLDEILPGLHAAKSMNELNDMIDENKEILEPLIASAPKEISARWGREYARIVAKFSAPDPIMAGAAPSEATESEDRRAERRKEIEKIVPVPNKKGVMDWIAYFGDITTAIAKLGDPWEFEVFEKANEPNIRLMEKQMDVKGIRAMLAKGKAKK
jgi:hypothetical protein